MVNIYFNLITHFSNSYLDFILADKLQNTGANLFYQRDALNTFANRLQPIILTLHNKGETMAKDITYLEMLLTEKWRSKREEILERDKRMCRNCRCGQNLEIHHRQYHRDTNTGMKREPWDYENKYLITLCHHCHEIGSKQYIIPVFNN